jgi:indolepyruvate ferredoxin oxidoreductase beta subunit
MLGALAASGRLPVPVEAFEAAIRRDGRAVEANLRGFAAGLAAIRQGAAAVRGDAPGKARAGAMATLADLEAQAARFAGAADIVVEGLRRLAAYQDVGYAQLYLDRLQAVPMHAPRQMGGCCARPRAISRSGCPMRMSSASRRPRSRRSASLA